VHIGTAEVQYSNDNRVSERKERAQDTQGLDEKQIREYIQNQEKMDMGGQGYLNF
jgi:hypothetical protein